MPQIITKRGEVILIDDEQAARIPKKIRGWYVLRYNGHTAVVPTNQRSTGISSLQALLFGKQRRGWKLAHRNGNDLDFRDENVEWVARAPGGRAAKSAVSRIAVPCGTAVPSSEEGVRCDEYETCPHYEACVWEIGSTDWLGWRVA